MENKNLNQRDGLRATVGPVLPMPPSRPEDLANLLPGTYIISSVLKSTGAGVIDVTVSDGVTLIFQGGRIEKGKATLLRIKGNYTALQAPISQIFGDGVEVTGSWLIDRAYPQWFDETVGTQSWETEEPIDCSTAINAASNMKQLGVVFLPRGNYFISKPIELPNGVQLVGDSEHKSDDKTTSTGKNGSLQASFLIPFMEKTNNVVHDGFKHSERGEASNQETSNVALVMINSTSNATNQSAWKIPFVNPCGMLKNITIDNSYYKNSTGNLTETERAQAWKDLSQKTACIVGGGFTFENVVITNFLKAIQWTNDYADSKKINHCQFTVDGDLKQNLTTPSYLVDMGSNGDGMSIHQMTTDWNIDIATHGTKQIRHNYRALRVGSCHGGSITDCILNTDVLFEGSTDIVFSGNHLEAGAQIRIVNSNLSIRNNWFEKGKRPSIVFDVKSGTNTPAEGTECFSQVQLSGNTFYIITPMSLYTASDHTSYERTWVEYLCRYDIALCSQMSMPYAIEMH